MAKQALNFVPEVYCQNCGQCCAELVDRLFWIKSVPDWNEKQHLIAERKKLAEFDRSKYANEDLRKKDGCDMLYFENDKSYCLVRVIYPKKAMNYKCVDYPFGKDCLRQLKEKENE